ncbi:hypothetical protein [Pseudalkalibacillus hwajinpoensis]|nr:hypothetical protein [Pseudalkalibacillus hwajinpoensis]
MNTITITIILMIKTSIIVILIVVARNMFASQFTRSSIVAVR